MRNRIALVSSAALSCLLAVSVSAQQTTPAASPSPSQNAVSSATSNKPGVHRLKPYVVYGTAVEPNKIDLSPNPAANPASVTVVEPPPEVSETVKTYGDFLRPLSGVVVNDFGQGGLGYGIALRGFDDTEHGRDVASFVDGVPVNQTSALQVNGYTDLNSLLPDLVDKVTLTRGPFDVRAGDFAVGGSVRYDTTNNPGSGATFSGGEFGNVHGVGTYSRSLGDLSGYAALAVDDTQGYRHNNDLMRINTFDKVVLPIFDGIAALRFQLFDDTFGAPGYINRYAVDTGKVSERDAINNTDGGNRIEENLVFNYREPDSEQPLAANLYAIHNEFNRYATFNTLPLPPTSPGQSQTLAEDRRYNVGGNADKFWLLKLPYGAEADFLLGGGLRSDIVGANQYDTVARVVKDHTTDANFTINNPFAYAQVDIKPVRWLKLTGGVRYDHFLFEINSSFLNTAASPPKIVIGNDGPDKGAFQPKGGITISPFKGLDLFANVGKGIRSPSAITDLGLNPGVKLATVTSVEPGVQYYSPEGDLHFLGSVYTTRLSNEIQQNFPLPAINLGPSRREGFDTEVGWRLLRTESGATFTALAAYSALRARLVGNQHGMGSAVPNAPRWEAKYGGEFRWPLFGVSSPQVLFINIDQQFIGETPLDTAAITRAGSYSRLNIVGWYENLDWQGAGAFLHLIAYPFGRKNEVAINFGGPVVAINPKPPVSFEGGVHIPLDFAKF